MVIFFFSSRRRHTRCSRDWSSDVCSSDLSGSEVHYRPKSYWKANTKLFVKVAVRGVPMGSGWFGRADLTVRAKRSEEHTSELQSRLHLVCRLLLEKKKKKKKKNRKKKRTR